MNRKKYTLGLYEKAVPNTLSYEEKLTCAAKYDYDFVEISIDETDEKQARLDYTPSQMRELKNAVQNTGIPFRSMCLSAHRKYPLGSPDARTADKSLEIMQKAVDFAAETGIRIIQLAGYDVYYEEGNEHTKALFKENLAKSVEMTASAGVLLGFETMETAFMDTVGKAMEYVSAVNSPYLGVYPDLGNITNAALLYGHSVQDDLESGRGHMLAMHLKETVPGKYREIPFGTGHVDFKGGIQKAWSLGVRRFVTEFWFTGDPRWEEEVGRISKMMHTLCASC
ncbi:L-ribulose-5-phosphate 3-epimerase [Treponema sp.]|uniref:L-ribulose-5-phosphate 3-epimerase n=1 Tax=Treponema sp. TaxID=166 RepID=UPI003FA1D041